MGAIDSDKLVSEQLVFVLKETIEYPRPVW